MAKELPKLFECKVKQENECRLPPCKEEFDPKSYCHNILSKPSKMCKKLVCRKFLKTNLERTKGEVVCLPRKPCKLKRHFGPESESDEDEDELFFRMYGSQLGLILDEGTVSETDLLKGKFGGRDSEYVARDGRYGGRFSDSKATPTQYGYVQDEETMKFLEDLSKYMDPEAMAALSAIAGAELCPCCECALCRCKLRGVTSEMLLAQRKKALLQARFNMRRYSWTFDYFYHPDLEYFEKEREERLKAERIKAEQEETSTLIEEMLREQGLYDDEEPEDNIINVTEYIQVGPHTTDRSTHTKTGILKEPGASFESEPWMEQIGIGGPKLSKEPALDAESLLSGHFTRPSLRSSIESWVEARKTLPHERRPSTVTGASVDVLDTGYPGVEIKGPIRIIPKVEIRDSTVLKPIPRWKSRDGIPRSLRPRKSTKKDKSSMEIDEDEEDEEVDVEEDYEEVDDNETIVSAQISSVTGEPIKIREDLAAKLAKLPDFDITKASAEAMRRAELRRQSITPSQKLYSDYCKCLPGYCKCGAQHYVFEDIIGVADVDVDVKPVTSDKATSIEEHEVEEEEDLSIPSSCVCIHPWDEISDNMKLTPSSSFGMEIVKPPTIYRRRLCKEPKYQQTLVIVKPDAMRFKDVILRKIKSVGLDILAERLVHLTPEQVAEIYTENYGSSYFALFVQRMSANPVLVLNVAGINAIHRWRDLISEDEVISENWFYPESIKRRFGIYSDIYCVMKSSTDYQIAKTEVRYFFPLDILDPIMIESEEVQDYCDKYIHPTLLKGLYKILKELPKNPLIFLAQYLLQNNPFQPKFTDPRVALVYT